MKFCDKLAKLRKDNNLSQELLADKLNVSRQAVSKWENGTSYPDMDKMIQMCKILNCTLDELMDDGIIKEKGNDNKININSTINDFLKFITSTYNMFCSMKFKDIIKCLVELCIIILSLAVLGGICNVVVDDIIFDLIRTIPKVGISISSILYMILNSILIIIGIVIFIHLFKIRYLDYYVTIEDSNVKEKIYEKDIDEKINLNNKKEKVIIRDPKHSSSSFIDFLVKIIIVMIKCMLCFVLFSIITTFIGLIIFMFMSLCHIKYGYVFIFIALGILGALLINYGIIEMISKFIIDKKQSFKKLFILLISGLIMIGANTGIVISMFMNFKVETVKDEDYLVKEEIIEVDNNTVIECYDNCKYEIDNNLVNKAKIEINYFDGIDVNYHIFKNDNFNVYNVYYDMNPIESYHLVLNSIKNKRIKTFDNNELVEVKIYVTEENYKLLINNYDRYNNE